MRILVVDDERAVRESLGRALELEGYKVEYAADGGEALYRLESDQPDAIVLDVLMPGIDGLEVARRVRRGAIACPCSCSRRERKFRIVWQDSTRAPTIT